MATGGEGIARRSTGNEGDTAVGQPGDRALVELESRKNRFARGRVIEVLEAGADRVPLTCDHAVVECGGCDWLHLTGDGQRRAKVELVGEQLVRLAGLVDPVVDHHPDPPGKRTSARCVVTDGRAGFRRRRSSTGFAATSCQAAHPLLEELIVEGRYGTASEVVLRVAPTTGQRCAIVDRDPSGVRVPPDVAVGVGRHADVAITHRVADRDWRVSAGAFFQTSDRGAETLVAAVGAALAGSAGPIVDLYAGVGLLGGANAERDRLDTVVESNRIACADARHNLDEPARVVAARVERWRPDRSFGAVVADPARAGLRDEGVTVVDACGGDRLVLVSCDPASLGRDASLLAALGWRHHGSVVVDMFADTSSIEVVSRFDR